MNYGRALKTARGSRGLSQRRLAKLAEVDPSTVSLIESGQRTPSSEVIDALARALGIPTFLLVFLASDDADLKGIRVEHAALIGAELMAILRATSEDS